MLVLALDTTSVKGGVGVYDGGKCLALEANTRPANIYSITLFEMAEQALKRAGIGLADIEVFAVANGPGSFTGIRVGVATMQAWATAFGRPLLGISVLEALVEEGCPETDWALPILDAHRGECYLGLYRRPSEPEPATLVHGRNDRPFAQAGEGWVLKFEMLPEFLGEKLSPDVTATCLVREHDVAVLAQRTQLPATYEWREVPGLLVGAIARLARRAHKSGRIQSPGEVDACYIRRPDAELNWKE